MKNPIEEKVNRWAITDKVEFREINQKILHLEKRLFSDYLPCQPPNPDFFSRLKNWIENISSEDDQKILYQLVPHLFYVGQAEFDSLYKTAYNVGVAQWLIEKIDLKFNNDQSEVKLYDAVSRTWFCATTDSFNINHFFKINNIPSQYNFRPDWHSLTALGDQKRIAQYIANERIERIVLLEDFVGSGSQVKMTIESLCKSFPAVQILFISLITCPTGITNLSFLETTYSNVAVRHIIQLDDVLFVSEVGTTGETLLFKDIREMAIRLYATTTNGIPPGPVKPYTPLGYKKTGGLVVLCNNTPDNTLPIIHFESQTWHPLFKRITRI